MKAQWLYDKNTFCEQLLNDYRKDLKYIKGNGDVMLDRSILLMYADTPRVYQITITYTSSTQIGITLVLKGNAAKGLLAPGFSEPDNSEGLLNSAPASSPASATSTTILSIPLSNKTNTVTLTLDNALSVSDYNRMVHRTRKARFFVGGFVSPNSLYRHLEVNSFQPESSVYEAERNINEIPAFSLAGGGQFGFSYGIHGFSLSYTLQEFGFDYNKSTSMDWQQGIYAMDTLNTRTHERQTVNTLGFNYICTSADKTLSPILLAGVYCSFDTKKAPHNIAQNRNGYFAAGVKGGLGVNWKPGYHWDIRMYPTFSCNTNVTVGTMLNTRFYNTGLEIGVCYSFRGLRIK
jgi:hypothetical protein